MDYAALLEADQDLACFVLELEPRLPDVGGSPKTLTFAELQGSTSTPGIVLKGGDLCLGAAFPNRDPGLPEPHALEGPAAICAFRRGKRTKRASELKSPGGFFAGVQLVAHLERAGLFPLQRLVNRFRNFFHLESLPPNILHYGGVSQPTSSMLPSYSFMI